MRIVSIVPICVATFAVACSQGPESGSAQRATGHADPVVAGATSPVRAGETDMIGSRGPIPVVVVGTAFGLDRATLEQTVANNMQGAAWEDAHFIPASQSGPGAAQGGNYSVVMLLNAPRDADPGAFCSSNASSDLTGGAQRAAGGRDVELAGALCRNGKDLRQVRTGADNVSGPNDPAFRKMVREATTELTLSAGEENVFHGSDQDR